MDITEVKVYPVDEDKLKAFATIVFEECFIVKDLKIIKGNSGLFVAMPNKRRKDGTFKDTAHPISPEMRDTIERKVIGKYYEECGIAPTERVISSSGYDRYEEQAYSPY